MNIYYELKTTIYKEVHIPRLQYKDICLQPRKISEDDLYIFSIPHTNFKNYRLQFRFKRPYPSSIDSMIEWMYGDRLVIDTQDLSSLALKLPFKTIQAVYDHRMRDNLYEFNLLSFVEPKSMWKKEDSCTYLDMELYSLCRDIRIKLNPHYIGIIDGIELHVRLYNVAPFKMDVQYS
jgi:hypothetical protein